LLKEVLGLAPLGELVLETDFARRGSRLHRVMADFYRQWPAVCAESALAVDEESAAFVNHLRRVIDEAIVATPRAGIDAALLELDRRQISKWAGRHFDHQQKYAGACAKLGGALAPAHFEFRFGPPRADDVGSDPSSTPDAFVIEVNGEPIRVTGQIDRIDVGSIHGKTFFNVIDYKSGKKTSFKPEHIESGERLQLPIYVEAAQMLLFRGAAKPLAAGYWSMSAGFDAKGALASAPEQGADNGDRWERTRATVRRRIGQIVEGIRRGDFPVASLDEKCTSFCEFHTVCRVAQARNLNKTWSPDAGCGPTPVARSAMSSE
jgi:RecB family exonuclease